MTQTYSFRASWLPSLLAYMIENDDFKLISYDVLIADCNRRISDYAFPLCGLNMSILP